MWIVSADPVADDLVQCAVLFQLGQSIVQLLSQFIVALLVGNGIFFLCKGIVQNSGMERKVENMEFDSIIAAVQSGKADVGVAGMTVTPDREENVSFTQGYATTTQVIIVRKD